MAVWQREAYTTIPATGGSSSDPRSREGAREVAGVAQASVAREAVLGSSRGATLPTSSMAVSACFLTLFQMEPLRRVRVSFLD